MGISRFASLERRFQSKGNGFLGPKTPLAGMSENDNALLEA
jgi:hypothetical protein